MSAAEQIVVETAGARQTEALGAALAGLLEAGDVVVLSGELGSGKTTLVRGVLEAIGPGVEVTSPTFTLCHLYESTPVVAHVDCWRLDDSDDLADLGIEEVLDDGGVALVEWGERVGAVLGREALLVVLTEPDGADGDPRDPAAPSGRRRVEVRTEGPGWARRAGALRVAFAAAGISARSSEARK